MPFVKWETKDCSGIKDQPTILLGGIPNKVIVYSILINNTTPNPLRVTLNVKGMTPMSLLTDYIILSQQTCNPLEGGLGQLTLNPLDNLEIYSNAPSQQFNVKLAYVVLLEDVPPAT